jgi:hypothetical protein
MSVLMPTSLVIVAVLVLAYILGTELCLPSARHALRTGEGGPWTLACRLVTAGEWSVLAVFASLLLIAEQLWQVFTATQAGRLLGVSAAGLLVAVVCWELAGRSRRHHARVMSTSLNLVLPATGARRDLYQRLHPRLETGSRAEQQRVLQLLLLQPADDLD